MTAFVAGAVFGAAVLAIFEAGCLAIFIALVITGERKDKQHDKGRDDPPRGKI